MGSVNFLYNLSYPQSVIISVWFKLRIIKPAAWWDGDEETKDILGGRDEKTGGTWLGCSKQGRVAFLVNVTNQTSFTHTGAELLTVKFLKVYILLS